MEKEIIKETQEENVIDELLDIITQLTSALHQSIQINGDLIELIGKNNAEQNYAWLKMLQDVAEITEEAVGVINRMKKRARKARWHVNPLAELGNFLYDA